MARAKKATRCPKPKAEKQATRKSDVGALTQKANDSLEAAEEIQERAIQAQALEHVPGAIKSLGKFSKGQAVNGVKPNSQVVRSSARDLIEFAGGRPETRDPRIGDSGSHLTIVIARFGDGTAEQVAPRVVNDVEKADPYEVADKAMHSISKAFEVPDAEV